MMTSEEILAAMKGRPLEENFRNDQYKRSHAQDHGLSHSGSRLGETRHSWTMCASDTSILRTILSEGLPTGGPAVFR